MGTNETKDLQNEIKKNLAQLSWSQKRFARELYTDRFDVDHDDELISFQEKIKKDLSRPTIKPALLKTYLDFITQHDDFKKQDLIYRPYQPSSELSECMTKGMAKISNDIEKLLLDD